MQSTDSAFSGVYLVNGARHTACSQAIAAPGQRTDGDSASVAKCANVVGGTPKSTTVDEWGR
ncbi:hypothetical protein O9992_21095 [Vibrio lentus]|nr:hypothetical protein [Vibrio lentus]